MERGKLQSEIGKLSSLNQPSKDIIDELKNIGASVTKLVAIFETASKRCCDLTEGLLRHSVKAGLPHCGYVCVFCIALCFQRAYPACYKLWKCNT